MEHHHAQQHQAAETDGLTEGELHVIRERRKEGKERVGRRKRGVKNSMLCVLFSGAGTTGFYALSLHDALPIWSI
mgnify:CR=1 FL=1